MIILFYSSYSNSSRTVGAYEIDILHSCMTPSFNSAISSCRSVISLFRGLQTANSSCCYAPRSQYTDLSRTSIQ